MWACTMQMMRSILLFCILMLVVMLHDEDTISSVVSLYLPSVCLPPPVRISTSLALFLSIMDTPDTISLLRTLSKIISDGVDKIDQSCTRLQLQFPSLDEPFTPANHAPHLDPQISEAVSIIVAAAAQITAVAQPAPVSLLTSALQVCGLLELCKINWSSCLSVVWCFRSNSYCYWDKYSGDTARSRSTGSLRFSALP